VDERAFHLTTWEHVAQNPDAVPIELIIEGMRSRDESVCGIAREAFFSSKGKGNTPC
jgi:hypothetical protein